MISHAFPPVGGSGVQRTAKFAKYLPQFGWKPIVWSAGSVPDMPHDATLTDDLPADLDHRIHPGVHPAQAAQRALRRVGRLSASERTWARGVGVVERRVQWLGYWAAGWSIPDGAVPWAIASLPALRRIVRHERIDALYSTFSPASNHLLAWRLKQLTGLPWVADFRDLWTDNFDFQGTSGLRYRLRRWLEQRFLESADAVISVSPDQTRILANHVASQKQKFSTIPNGADAEDFAQCDRARIRRELSLPADRFVLSYVGGFVASAEPLAIVEGLETFVRQLPNRARFEFRIVGTIPASVMRFVDRSGIRPTVTGYVEHARAVREMVAADALLLGNTTTGRNCASILPGKLFEYFAAGRPIVHVGPAPGATDTMIRECHAGVTVPPEPTKIAETISVLLDQWESGNLTPGCPPERLSPYTRRALAQEMAGVLNGLTASAARPSNACDSLARRVVQHSV